MKRDWRPFTIFATLCIAAVASHFVSVQTYTVWQDRELNENFDDYSAEETVPVAEPCGESHAVPITRTEANEGVLIAAVASSHLEVCDVKTGKPLQPSP